MEFDLLKAFLDHPNQVLSRDRLLTLTRNREWEPFDRSIDIRITRLRRKIEDDPGEPAGDPHRAGSRLHVRAGPARDAGTRAATTACNRRVSVGNRRVKAATARVAVPRLGASFEACDAATIAQATASTRRTRWRTHAAGARNPGDSDDP